MLCLLVFGLGLLSYGYFIESHWVEETHRELRAEHWRGRPLRLAVIADLHARRGDGDYIDLIVRRTIEARPDVVLMLGDYINRPEYGNSMDLETLRRHLAPLMQLPCYAIIGNHDYIHGEEAVCAMLQSFGVRVMEGKVHGLDIGGDTLYIGGVRSLYEYDMPGEVAELPEKEDVTHIILTHSPTGAKGALPETTAVLAAHTHGGQICLPGGIPLIGMLRHIPWREMQGIIREVSCPIFVTRGLGMSKMPLRLFCRPELLFVELRGVPQS